MYLCPCHSAQFFTTLLVIKLQDTHTKTDLSQAGCAVSSIRPGNTLLHSLISKPTLYCAFFYLLGVCLCNGHKIIYFKNPAGVAIKHHFVLLCKVLSCFSHTGEILL